MNPRDYQGACKAIAIYPRDCAIAYVEMGLIGELGEFANQYKKSLRDDGGKITAERREKLIGELGDLCWYVAMYATEVKRKFPERMRDGLSYQGDLDHWMIKRLDHSLHAYIQDDGDYWADCEAILQEIEMTAWCLEIKLYSLFDRNIAKLASRQDRGTLHGSGDTR